MLTIVWWFFPDSLINLLSSLVIIYPPPTFFEERSIQMFSQLLLGCLFNLYAEYIMRNTGLEETQAGIKTVGRNINNLRYADDTTLMAESEEELKKTLDQSERRE